jgi:hypothetical protein
MIVASIVVAVCSDDYESMGSFLELTGLIQTRQIEYLVSAQEFINCSYVECCNLNSTNSSNLLNISSRYASNESHSHGGRLLEPAQTNYLSSNVSNITNSMVPLY